MFGKSFENMVRYYHSDGASGVVGDNATEVEALWSLISETSNGKIDGIPVETWKKVGPPPRILCNSDVQAIEMADALNKGTRGNFVGMILGLVTMSK